MTYGNIASLKSGLPPWFSDDQLIGQLDGKALYAGDLRALIARAESKKEEAVEKVEPISDELIATFIGLEGLPPSRFTIGRLLARIDHERGLREKAEGLADVGQRLLQAIEAGQKHHRAMRNWRAVSTPAEIVLHLLCEIDTTETEAKRLREAAQLALDYLNELSIRRLPDNLNAARDTLSRALAQPGAGKGGENG